MLKAIIRTNPIAPRITIQERMVKSAGYSSKIRIKLENMRRTSHFLFLCVLPTHGRFITFIASQGKPTTVFPSTHCFSLFMQRLNSSDSRCSPTRTKHPYVQFTRLQRLSVGPSQPYRCTDIRKESRLYSHQMHGYPMNIDYKFEFFKNLHEQVR